MALFVYAFAVAESVFPRFVWGMLVPAGVVSFFVFGLWPLTCSKIGLINKKSHLDLINDIKGVIETTETVRGTVANDTASSASASSSENNEN